MSYRSVDPAMKQASSEVSTLMGFKNLKNAVFDNRARKKLLMLQIKPQPLKHLLPRKKLFCHKANTLHKSGRPWTALAAIISSWWFQPSLLDTFQL